MFNTIQISLCVITLPLCYSNLLFSQTLARCLSFARRFTQKARRWKRKSPAMNDANHSILRSKEPFINRPLSRPFAILRKQPPVPLIRDRIADRTREQRSIIVPATWSIYRHASRAGLARSYARSIKRHRTTLMNFSGQATDIRSPPLLLSTLSRFDLAWFITQRQRRRWKRTVSTIVSNANRRAGKMPRDSFDSSSRVLTAVEQIARIARRFCESDNRNPAVELRCRIVF